ncbi:methyltransferase domain-containing protein [Luteibacter sp. UNCMF366Tsu5.1]|uniref:methyltransferase domain-containing protein n=1 Tax=Luteibacter sp. UNCMF366Tsu5.1 TaxID=1502758 RepID=UPI0009090929|nr:class I SAM-dependent methyltransferase [Luteibacter sp. UNCMF366Tsu5.1]SFW34029.1 Methyltransferase domain-containing protein [Luteibacter sp. UNCMF366Tsu5.1]
MAKTYDQAYFDKWYRSAEHAVRSPAELQRKVAMVLGQAEFYLGRPVRNVLDVGCGEAPWRAVLRRLRPGIDYRGLEASEYAVARYGRSRNIGYARFGQLAELRFDTRFDLIVCTDVLHYLAPAEIRAGLIGIGEMVEGLAFLEVYTREDDPGGDRQGFIGRPARWYREAFASQGLIPVGSQCYASPRLARHVASLERL